MTSIRFAFAACLVLAIVGSLPLTAQAAAPYTVLLHSRQFVPPPGPSGTLPSGNRVHALVQFVRFPTSADDSQLRALGLTRLAYVPDRA